MDGNYRRLPFLSRARAQRPDGPVAVAAPNASLLAGTKKLDGLDSGDASFAPTYDLLAKRRKRAEVRLQVASS